jgi:hypothetical protein
VIRGLAAADSAVHPLGTLTVRQHAVPLGLRIDRYGPDLLDAPCQYDLVDPQIGGTPDTNVTLVTDYFAPSQFDTMTDAEKLSSPSFQPMTSGMTFGPPGYVLPLETPNALSSEDFYALVVDSPDTSDTIVTSTLASVPVSPTMLTAQQACSAAALNGAASQGAARYSPRVGGTIPNVIRLKAPTYALVDRSLGSLVEGEAPPVGLSSYGAAAGSLAGMGASRGAGQVVYSSEVR